MRLLANTNYKFIFTGSGGDGVADIIWDFGDGTVEHGSEVIHSYKAGTYTLKLKVVNECGAEDVKEEIVEVVEKPMEMNAIALGLIGLFVLGGIIKKVKEKR